MRVNRLEGSNRTRGEIDTDAKAKRKGKNNRIVGIKQVHDNRLALGWLIRA
jgi:hypothetical protein